MKLKIRVMKHSFMCLLLGLSLSVNALGAVFTEDFSVTPALLNFGSVPNTQAKSLTFKAESRKVADYTVTVTAPFTVSPASGHFGVIGAAVGTAEDTITVSLPANLPPGVKSGTLTVEFRPKFPLGNVTKVKRTVSLSATVTDPNAPTGFDLSTTLEPGNVSITQTIRHVGIKINAKVQGGNTAAYKTRMLVSVDGAAEIEVYNGLVVYVPNATQAFVLVHDINVSVRTIKFRIITDPDNTVVEINENNNTQTITRTF